MKEINFNNTNWNPPQIKENEMITDTFRKARGGKAMMLTLYCASCNSPLLLYQKDGTGNLYRCYIDRILYPIKYRQMLSQFNNVKRFPQLKCQYCNAAIGTPMVYEKENRFAYGLFVGKFYRRKVK